jgi:uncharacterized membrane protein
MEILQIILSVVTSLAYGAAAGFAIAAWVRLYRMQKDVKDMKHTLAVTGTLVMSMHVKSSIVELNDMKRTLRHLIEDEQFEEAEKLQNLIVKAEKNAMETIEKMNSAFGDIAEIHVTKTNL